VRLLASRIALLGIVASLLILGGCLQTSQPPIYEIIVNFRFVEHETFPAEDQIISTKITLIRENEELWSENFGTLPEQVSLYVSPGTYSISVSVKTYVGTFRGTATQELEPGENIVSLILCPQCGS